MFLSEAVGGQDAYETTGQTKAIQLLKLKP